MSKQHAITKNLALKLTGDSEIKMWPLPCPICGAIELHPWKQIEFHFPCSHKIILTMAQLEQLLKDLIKRYPFRG